MKYSNFIGK